MIRLLEFLNIRNSSPGYKECILKHLLNSALSWTFSFFGLLSLPGVLFNILMPALYTLFWKCEWFRSWFMSMVFIPCVNTVYSWICLKIFLITCTKFEYFMYLWFLPHSSVCMTHIWMHGMYVYMCVCVFLCMFVIENMHIIYI